MHVGMYAVPNPAGKPLECVRLIDRRDVPSSLLIDMLCRESVYMRVAIAI